MVANKLLVRAYLDTGEPDAGPRAARSLQPAERQRPRNRRAPPEAPRDGTTPAGPDAGPVPGAGQSPFSQAAGGPPGHGPRAGPGRRHLRPRPAGAPAGGRDVFELDAPAAPARPAASPDDPFADPGAASRTRRAARWRSPRPRPPSRRRSRRPRTCSSRACPPATAAALPGQPGVRGHLPPRPHSGRAARPAGLPRALAAGGARAGPADRGPIEAVEDEPTESWSPAPWTPESAPVSRIWLRGRPAGARARRPDDGGPASEPAATATLGEIYLRRGTRTRRSGSSARSCAASRTTPTPSAGLERLAAPCRCRARPLERARPARRLRPGEEGGEADPRPQGLPAHRYLRAPAGGSQRDVS